MNKSIGKFALGALLFLSGNVNASIPIYEEPPSFDFHFGGGFRQDQFRFHVGGPHGSPKTFSKATWKELRIAELSAWVDNSTCCGNYYIRANGDYGRISHGSGSVKNYTTELSSSSSSSSSSSETGGVFSRQSVDARRGYVADITGGVGWKVISEDGRTWIAGVGGWTYNRQSLHMNHFKQKKDVYGLVGYGKIPGLHGRYHTNWSGPWLGIDFSSYVECSVFLFGSVEWHWASYQAEGNWDYDHGVLEESSYASHIKHKARAYGIVGTLGMDWMLCDENWSIGVMGNYAQMSTRKGHNRASVHDNLPIDDPINLTFPVVERSHLRRAKWITYSVLAQLSYRF